MADYKLFDTIAIIGVGLIGGSIALAAKKKVIVNTVIGSNHRAETLEKAFELKIIDKGDQDPGKIVREADLVIICTPLSTFDGIISGIAPFLKPEAIVTDVGSIKQMIVESARQAPEGKYHFIAGHPIAGTEKSGPEAAFPELFEGRKCILTPTDDTNSRALDRLTRFWEALGSEVVTLSPKTHDIIYAYVSHMAQFLASAYMLSLEGQPEQVREAIHMLEDEGFRRFIRIGGSNPVMWRDIFLFNREEILNEVASFQEQLTRLIDLLTSNKRDELLRLFTEAQKHRKRLSGGFSGQRGVRAAGAAIYETLDFRSQIEAVLLPRLIGAAYVLSDVEKEKEARLDFSGYSCTGFIDITTYASADPKDSVEALLDAAESVAGMAASFNRSIDHLKRLTETEETEELEQELRRAKQAYEELVAE